MSEINFGIPPNPDDADEIAKKRNYTETAESVKQKLALELIKPASIVAEVKSLFEQYALPDKRQNPDFSTPEVPVTEAQYIEDFSNTIFISHITDNKNVFAVMNSNLKINAFFTLPILTFEGSGDNAIVYGNEAKSLTDGNELQEARLLIEYLKFCYRSMVRENADTIKLSKYLSEDNRRNVDAAMLFHFAGQNPLIDYKPAIVDVVLPEEKPEIVFPDTPLKLISPSEAFTEAIETFYSAYGEVPSQHGPSQIEFKGVEILINDQVLPISFSDMPYFTGLFREQTVFDSDRDLIDRLLRQMPDCEDSPTN